MVAAEVLAGILVAPVPRGLRGPGNGRVVALAGMACSTARSPASRLRIVPRLEVVCRLFTFAAMLKRSRRCSS